jgi:hypothetical protein
VPVQEKLSFSVCYSLFAVLTLTYNILFAFECAR